MKPLCNVFVVLMAMASFSASAHATHKAWLLKNSGGQCAVQVTTTSDAYPGVLENHDVGGLYVTCPVTLASQGGSASGPQNFQEPWLSAKQARIFYQNINSYFWCQARAEDIWGNVYYGASNHSNSASGFQSIDLIVSEYDWGGDLEANEQGYMEQLDIECRVGAASGGSPGRLLGYEVATCQTLSNCNTVRTDNRGLNAYVQGSGIECAPSTASAAGVLERSEAGITNTGSSTVSTHCPITQATDDSYEHHRQISVAQVHFTGSTPTCRIEGIDKNGTQVNSPNLSYDALFGWLEIASTQTVNLEKALNLKCDLPANSTIIGWVMRMSVTRKSGGI